jgi:hypothetical protein
MVRMRRPTLAIRSPAAGSCAPIVALVSLVPGRRAGEYIRSLSPGTFSIPGLPGMLHTITVVALVLLAAAPAAAADLALGVRAGTAGVGPELTLGLSRQVHARLAAGFLTYDTTYDDTGVRYDGELELRNALLLLDWHPGGGGFRFSVGGAWNDNQLAVSAPLRELVRRERPELLPLLPAGDLGRLHGTAAGASFAPYAGFGWGTPFGGRGRWGVNLDVGALYHGEPEVDLRADLAAGLPLPPGGSQLLDALAAQEARQLEEELADYRYLPVLSLGVTFRF